jgi:ribosome-associated protein
MLRVSRDLSIDENDIDISFVRASGPGGQNVNKLSTAAQLRFDTRKITLPADAEIRLNRLAGQRMTKDGVIVIHAQRFRTQERNRADAIDRLLELLREAMTRPTPRRHQGEARLGPIRRVKHFQANWRPVRVKKTRHIKNLEPRFDSIETEKALELSRDSIRHVRPRWPAALCSPCNSPLLPRPV